MVFLQDPVTGVKLVCDCGMRDPAGLVGQTRWALSEALSVCLLLLLWTAVELVRGQRWRGVTRWSRSFASNTGGQWDFPRVLPAPLPRPSPRDNRRGDPGFHRCPSRGKRFRSLWGRKSGLFLGCATWQQDRGLQKYLHPRSCPDFFDMFD